MNEGASESIAKPPKWLKHFQENSWEAEILISGGAIFSLFQFSDYLIYIKTFLSENKPIAGLDPIIIFCMLTIKGVTFGFILHLFLRGLWIAMVCVNSAFPNGVNRARLRFTGKYSDDLSDPTLTVKIASLDRVCGLVFYSAFAYVMAVTGIVILSAFLFALKAIMPWLLWILIVPLLIFFITDLLSSGWFRRNKQVGKIYYPVYIFFNTLSLLFIYRKSLQIVFSNARKLPTILFVTIFIIISFSLSYFSLYKALNRHDPFREREYPATKAGAVIRGVENFYIDNIADGENIRWFAIQSEIVTQPYLKLFITYRETYRAGIEASGSSSFDQIVTVTINDVVIKNPDWFAYVRVEANQSGIITMIPMAGLPSGKNIIEVHIDDPYFDRFPALKLPFWKE